jgi:tRNA (guanine37-N1)-methyltransferase
LRKRLSEMLMETLSPQDSARVCNSYDVVGDIAIVRLNEKSTEYSEKIAEAIMAVHKNVKTVLARASAVSGVFRLRRLEYVAGERKTCTVHRESGCVFSVDVEKCYFSPRLFYERMRVAGLAEHGETVVNMFAGVGCFSIVMAKHAEVEKVYSIDINPHAFRQMRENIRVNRVYGRVIPVLGDAGTVVKKKLRRAADRVLMPLPAKALEYLPYAMLALKERGGWVHYYDFEHATRDEDAVDKAIARVSQKLRDVCTSFEIPFGRIVRATGPNWYQIALDIKAKPSSACTRPS